MCGVRLEDGKRTEDLMLMLGMNEATDHVMMWRKEEALENSDEVETGDKRRRNGADGGS